LDPGFSSPKKLKRVDGEFALTPLSVFDTARDSVAANDRI